MSLDHARLVRSAEQRLRRQLERGRARTAEPATPPTTIETVPARNVQGDGLARVEAWFARQGMQPFAFQRDTWAHYRAGASGLIHASTGTGKTLAAWLGPVMEAIDEEACNVRHPGFEHSSAGSIATSRIAAPRDDISRRHCEKSPVRGRSNPGASEKRASESALQVLWITPMRALAGDTMRAISLPLIELRAYRPCESVCLAIGAQCAPYLQSVDQRLRAGNAECQSGRPVAAARQKPL